MKANTIRRTIGIEEHRRTLAERDEVQEGWLRAEQDWIISGALQDRKIEKLTTRVLELEQEIVDLGVAPPTGGIDWWKEESKRNQASLDVVRREKVRELAALDRKVERLEAEVEESKIWRASWSVSGYETERNRLYARIAGLVAEVSGLQGQLRQARSKSVEIPY